MKGIDAVNTKSMKMVCSVVHLPAQSFILPGCYKTESWYIFEFSIVLLFIGLVSMLIYVSTSSVIEEISTYKLNQSTLLFFYKLYVKK